MKQIIHIITDNPIQVNKFHNKNNVLILPFLGTTEEGRPDHSKKDWHFEITIENNGEVNVKKSE